ncbi:MAG: hypothetical protein QG650_468 [Patescibacteria group bacterium]|nr:hypothetical protein [Patescibacteria group bacterium]
MTGSNLSEVGMTAETFEGGNCSGTVRCSLKISLIRTLQTSGGNPVPYLEYRITSPTAAGPIPQQWTRIVAEGYSR